jgi:hypothetical protein
MLVVLVLSSFDVTLTPPGLGRQSLICETGVTQVKLILLLELEESLSTVSSLSEYATLASGVCRKSLIISALISWS